MPWWKALLSLLSSIAGYFREKQLLDAGRAQERSEGRGEAIDETLEANRIRNRIAGDHGERDRLHEKYRRQD